MYENELYAKGINVIAGVDEVGRGPLVGPVVACCCVLPRDFKLDGLTDSKKLSEKKRDEYYKYLVEHYFINTHKIPDIEMFEKPQYNTWIEMPYECTEEKILKYANEILHNGFPAGVLMIDDCWCKDYGTWEFDPEKFKDPKGMVDKLHKLGFKVMVWCCPFVSPD